MDNYIIGFDEQFGVYIAHANLTNVGPAPQQGTRTGGGRGRGFRQNVKYKMKVGDRYHPRYLYTDEEVRAYLRGGRNNQNGTRSASPSSNDVAPNRPTGRQRKVTGKAAPIQKGRRVEGSATQANSPSAPTNRFNRRANEKQKELGEAVNAVDSYSRKRVETKRAAKALKENAKESATYGAINALLAMKGYKSNQLRFAAANSKRDTKAAADATKKALKEQAGAGKTAVKEIGDFAKVAAKSAVEDKTDRIKAEIQKQKSKDTPENLYEQMYGVKPKKPHVTIVETDGSRFEKKVKDKLNSAKDRMKEEFQKKKDDAKDVAEGVKAYREWDKNPSKESFDAVNNNKTASGIREARNNLHDKLDNMAWKAAKGLEGADVRKEFEKASDEFQKNPTPENKQKRDELYDKWAETPHGKFINNEFIAGIQQNGLKDTVKDAVDEGKGRVKESVKSTSDRMKEEFQKKKDSATDKVKDKLGYDERERYEAANKEHMDYGNKTGWKKSEELTNLGKKVDKAEEEYENTPLGKAEIAKNRVHNAKEDVKAFKKSLKKK